MDITFVTSPQERSAIAREILTGLPEWFGIPESTGEYIRCCADMPFVAAVEDGRPLGFMCLRETSAYTAEVYVCGVQKSAHRQGVGSALFRAIRDHARSLGYEYLQVKTVAAGCYAEYDRTRLFYERMGFRALEVFPTLWDECNTCLVMIMRL